MAKGRFTKFPNEYQVDHQKVLKLIDIKRFPTYAKLLEECNQKHHVKFDDIVKAHIFNKVGSGAYGTCYRTNDRVFKIAPVVMNKDKIYGKGLRWSLGELVTTKKLSALRNSSGKNRTYGVPKLWNSWIVYDFDLKSEVSGNKKLYVVYEMEYCGPSLRTFYTKQNPEKIILSIIEQIGFVLAASEAECRFEHRDLHLDNILLQPTEEKYVETTVEGTVYRTALHGYKATLIDFGLSHSTVDDVDYSFELSEPFCDYRDQIIRECWNEFFPETNLKGILYLLSDLLGDLADSEKWIKKLNKFHEANSCQELFTKYSNAALETLPQNHADNRIIIHSDKLPPEEHERRYNAPMTNEVALLMVGQEFGPRDIVLHCRNNLTQRISEIHQAYDPLQYLLIFCRGEVGYSVSLPQVNPSTREIMQKTVSCMNFYAYRMMARAGEFNSLLRYGMLTNQFWVDMYAKVETERLSFIRRNQKKLRTENYIHLQDTLRVDENLANIGQIVILPSSFTGGPRYLHEQWQKRGLPHAHLLLWLTNIIRPNQIDEVIQAEIPDNNLDPELHAIVMKQMVHGPCGVLNTNSPCMKDGKCSKKYPKGFCETTSTTEDGYPRYRRRCSAEGGLTSSVNMRGVTFEIDNRWIVPYNSVLLRAFDSHINVEYCSSVKAIKYVCKYINKGTDQAVFSLNHLDEVTQFQSGRYISSAEAVWRILGFSIHERSPPIVHLAVHLENGQRVYFTTANAENVISNPRDTTLTAFFKALKQGTPVEGFPGVRKSDVLGRVYTVHPTNAECYYLRLLLFHIRGPCSFQSLRTVEGVIHTTFQMACKALGLLEDDSHWNETLKEASICRNAASVRALFSTMLIFCHMSDTLTLWHAHKECMSEDILHRMRRDMSIPELDYNADVFNAALLEIDKHVLSISGLARFFLDAPGGTGKTFIINLLLAKLRLEGLVIFAAASAGIAATLLDGGRTAHSLFKLPLNLYDDELAVCNIAKQSATSKILQQCSLFIWDECTMAHRRSIEALDRTLKDLRDNNSIMGGVTFLFVGDFRQTLPVIPKGTRADEVNACLKRSHIWSSIVKLSLTINMRSHLFGDRGSSFSQLLLELGNGTFATHEGLISIASSDLCVLVEDIHTLISSVYPNIGSLLTMPLSWFSERALLAPRNDAVDKINEYILGKFIAPSRTYLSIDTVVDPNDSVHYPIEFSNSINPPGMPVHSLTLKVGAPIILLRNLNPPKLCNGIRLQVNSLHRYLLEATILTGCGTDYSFEFSEPFCDYRDQIIRECWNEFFPETNLKGILYLLSDLLGDLADSKEWIKKLNKFHEANSCQELFTNYSNGLAKPPREEDKVNAQNPLYLEPFVVFFKSK
ncbi:hypothetical protein LAZ67_14000329 [Cordylochernes scorpioides]|uniref:ATP-dependent DNA helicase n=1 Tax=Cordylochernes scorpioides TaxID=51811 RepID=A0ABY6L872_9ARAC|nr:hypothetical protein LAZ67_14000329 [Cordylochernes scorpioides]